MNKTIVFYIITLALASVSLASENFFLFAENEKKLQVKYGSDSPSKSLKLDFYEGCINEDPKVCKTNKTGSDDYYLRYFSDSERQECLNFEQVAQSMNDILKFCVDMENSSWYGGAETKFQKWPLNKLDWTDKSFITKEDEDCQAVVESYFFNSNGFYVHINDSVALFVDINGPRPGHMCFTAKVIDPYRKFRNVMQFRVCKFGNPREAHENAIKDFLGQPKSIPDANVVENPIWSTWARYKVDVNSSSVRSYAQEILNHGFPRGTIEIGDNWETCYGSKEFNSSRFENISGLVSELRSNGFKTSLWTHPFINLNCDKHAVGKAKGYFVNSTLNTVNLTWWNGKGSYVDFTNPEAANWWSNDLHELLAKSGIDTLKFDAGESKWTPQLPVYYDKDLTYYPDNIVNAYLKTVVSFGNAIEYRSSRRSQEFGRFLRMMDRYSRWDFKLGLPTLITSLIHLNMIGYPFVLPDMIGGNGYNNSLPSKEMYIRWMQANTFMPAIQFSYTPWDFDKETIDICKKFMNIRSNYTNVIIDLMKNSVTEGSPLNPPVWWIDPTDPVAQSIDDEYLLGENILVAPVIVERATSRDVYLPAGLWRDENRPDLPLIQGRTWLHKYPANLEVLPWFTKVTETSSSASGVSPAFYVLLLSLTVYLFR